MKRALRILAFFATISMGSAASGETAYMPLDVGVGPAANMLFGPVFQDRPVHFGLRISTAIILDKATLRQQKHKIPRQFRKSILRSGEVRLNPFGCCIPSSIYISPPIANTPFADTGMYGATLKPIGVGLNLLGGDPTANLFVRLGVVATYFYMHSTTLASPTHFLRPGLEGNVELEIPFSDSAGISLGWASMAHLPQAVGGPIFKLAPLDEAIWHIGQGYLKFHFRKNIGAAL